jgi:hypothetical protein
MINLQIVYIVQLLATLFQLLNGSLRVEVKEFSFAGSLVTMATVAHSTDIGPTPDPGDNSKNTSLYLGAVRLSVQCDSHAWSRLLIK